MHKYLCYAVYQQATAIFHQMRFVTIRQMEVYAGAFGHPLSQYANTIVSTILVSIKYIFTKYFEAEEVKLPEKTLIGDNLHITLSSILSSS